MTYINENKYIEVCFPFKGEEMNVAIITKESNEYLFTDTLFGLNYTIRNQNLDKLKLKVEQFYSARDSIGMIETRWPYLFA